VFWFSPQIVSEIFLILRRIERDIINVHKYSCKVPVILVKFWRNLNFLDKFEKYSNIKFHENPSSGSRVVPCRRTDMTKLIVTFRNFAKAPKTFWPYLQPKTEWVVVQPAAEILILFSLLHTNTGDVQTQISYFCSQDLIDMPAENQVDLDFRKFIKTSSLIFVVNSLSVMGYFQPNK
jgi:hypothetical protein